MNKLTAQQLAEQLRTAREQFIQSTGTLDITTRSACSAEFHINVYATYNYLERWCADPNSTEDISELFHEYQLCSRGD